MYRTGVLQNNFVNGTLMVHLQSIIINISTMYLFSKYN